VLAVALTLLVIAACLLVDFSQLGQRQLLGISGDAWFILALAVPVVHQIYVWITWRSQLCYAALTDLLGKRAFVLYQVVFVILLLSRPITLLMLTIVDHDSLTIPIPIRLILCSVLGIPAAYAMYSVVRFFGMSRAAGKDHFDESYRNMPLVTEGIFRYTSNGMYLVVFLGVWAIAIAGASWATLVAAGFSHAYIWVHFYCTERPDMQLIYGD